MPRTWLHMLVNADYSGVRRSMTFYVGGLFRIQPPCSPFERDENGGHVRWMGWARPIYKSNAIGDHRSGANLGNIGYVTERGYERRSLRKAWSQKLRSCFKKHK